MRETSRVKDSVFDSVPYIYDTVRPPYPEPLIDELVKAANLTPNSRILEIGTGTGKLTLALAKRGLRIHGVELGRRLAETARNNLRDYGNVKIETHDFDTWHFEHGSFDLVVAATAYHWLDKETRVGRISDVLKENGMVAIIDTVHLDSKYDNFPEASQKCYSKWGDKSTDEYHHPTLHEATVTGFRRREEFFERFETILDKPYAREVEYDSGTYMKLLQTYSDVITMPDPSRKGFLQCIGNLIENEFHNSIIKSYLWQLFLARKK